uniref:phosphatidylinositol-3,4,5-trisphosphate 5-phosphatase n=1 Tax=Gouania willdenowi TaxID=441366 RepID=A0A8C5G4N2_GOUWI
ISSVLLVTMATAAWYHRDISRVHAEDLLARAGRDGSYLVRDSESVPGAYTTQGVQVNCFRTLEDLILGYQHPHKGLITPLLYPIPRDVDTGDESSGGHVLLLFCSTLMSNLFYMHSKSHETLPMFVDSTAGEVIGLLNEYLFSELPLDIESVLKGATTLSHLKSTLSAACQGLNSEIDLTLSNLETLAKVFDHPSCTLTPTKGPDMEIESLLCKISALVSLLSSLEKKVCLFMLTKPLGAVQVTQTLTASQKCDSFCKLLQLMKTRHSQQSEPDMVSVFVGTWNMGGSPPPRGLQSWATCCGLGHTPDESIALLPHDIYAFGSQENPQGEREWTEHIKATLRSYTHIDFKQVAVQSLWNMRLAVFVKPQLESRVSHVTSGSVKTGLGNTLGNKGAVGVSFLFNGTSFGFVNCHLTSGSEKVLRRNQNFVDILRLLSLGDKQLAAFDISLRFTHLFWCGDLNYRLDLDVQDILKHVSKREFEELMCADQLTQERHRRKAFLNFKEEKITFPPTYRYERGSRDCYLWQKYKTSGVRVNVPSWCDRILWKSYPETHNICTAYGCTDDIFTSDHSPVFATFQVGVTSSPRSKSGAKSWIELEVIEAIVKTSSKARFFIEFHSSCLEEPRRSSENDSQSCDVPRFLKLGWSFKQLPKLLPLLSDMDYLQDQHLLLSVKSCDGFESYGECCVALRSLTGVSEQFETFLSHRGEEMGSIRGRVRIHVPKERRGTRRKIYGETTSASFSKSWPCLHCHFPPSFQSLKVTAFFNSPVGLTLLPLFGFSMTPGLALHCWYLLITSSFGS